MRRLFFHEESIQEVSRRYLEHEYTHTYIHTYGQAETNMSPTFSKLGHNYKNVNCSTKERHHTGMHPACMHVNTCTNIPQHPSTSIQLNRYHQKYINLWLWPKRPPLAFYMAEMSVAEMSWPKCPWPKRPWPKYPTFHYHIPLILGRFRPSKQITSVKSVRSYSWMYCAAHQFLQAPMGARHKFFYLLSLLN